MNADLTSKPSCLRLLCRQHEACGGGLVVLCLHTHHPSTVLGDPGCTPLLPVRRSRQEARGVWVLVWP